MAKTGSKNVERKGKKAKVRKPGKKLSALYTISGEKISRKNRFCPKCGPGMYMGHHKNRQVCGHCGYVEYIQSSK